jgi:WD40 repeat protein
MMNVHGRPNVGPAQIQLYRYTNRAPTKPGVPSCYCEWIFQKNTKKIRYRSTLHIEIGGVPAPKPAIVKGIRPTLPTDEEVGKIEFSVMLAQANIMNSSAIQNTQDDPEMQVKTLAALQRRAEVRSRRAHETCFVPNVELHRLSCGTNGCSVLKFSPDGQVLAAACGEVLLHTIKLYNVETGRCMYTYTGHSKIVYDLCWSG